MGFTRLPLGSRTNKIKNLDRELASNPGKLEFKFYL